MFYALTYLSACISWRIRATRARVVHEREYIRKSYWYHPFVRRKHVLGLAPPPIHFKVLGS